MSTNTVIPNLRFTLVGPLRSGSSLLSRCIDDHSEAICLCESEINRTLYPGHFYSLHARRMRSHGLTETEIFQLLDGKAHYRPEAFEAWHNGVFRLLKDRLDSPEAHVLGDKSPDFYRSPKLVEHLVASHRLIYTIRDPRAIYRSIYSDDTPIKDKRRRWSEFRTNFEIWKPHLEIPGLLVVKYEELVSKPEKTMAAVYQHLGLGESNAFLAAGLRKYPQRFLWKTNVNMETGEVRPIDAEGIDKWKSELKESELNSIESDPLIGEFRATFGYA